MRDRFPLIALAVAVFGAAAIWLGASAARRGGFAQALSTYRSERDGARALFLLASAAELKTQRRHVDAETIEGKGVLVLLGIEGDAPAPERAPAKDGPSPSRKSFFMEWVAASERKEIKRFVEDGGQLVYVFGSPQRLAEDLGLTFTPESPSPERELLPAVPSVLTRGVEQAFARVSGYVNRAAGAVPLLVDPHAEGEAVAIAFRLGQGRVVAIAAPDLASNRAIARGDNATFWVSLLGGLAKGGTVEFDEYHHGFTGERSVAAWAARYGLHFAALQLVAALVLFAWSTRRFGRPGERRSEERLAAADYLVAMARIYRQGGHRSHAAHLLLEGLRRHLVLRSGASARAAAQAVADTLVRQGRPELATGLADVARQVAGSPLGDGDLLRIARQAALLRRRADRAARGETRPRKQRRGAEG